MRVFKLWATLALALGAFDETAVITLHIHMGPINQYTIPILVAGSLLEGFTVTRTTTLLRRRIRQWREGVKHE